VTAFDVDGMLGALTKWLRILGFDAAYPCSTPASGRIFVTMKRVAGRSDTIVVEDQDPVAQLKQVLEEAGISPDPELFLTRCLICNVPVEEIPRDKVAGRVPEQVFQKVTLFNECPTCGRIYWEGSHDQRIKKRLQKAGIDLKESLWCD
jgi:uncharacterized protein with PIN domain